MNKEKRIKFGFPIGAIQDETIDLLERAGYKIEFLPEIEKVEIDDPEIECIPLRPIPIVDFVKKGILDAGISTRASVVEVGDIPEKLIVLEDKKYILGKTKVVLAVPEDFKIKKVKDLKGKRIITRIPNITKKFLKKNKISAEVIFSDTSANESKVGNIADAIVEFTKTGNVLRAYRLKILATILESSPVLIASKKALRNKWKKEKIKNLGNILQGALSQKFSDLMLRESELKGLDEIDWKIVQILSENGRESFVDMADKIGLSAVGIKQRVEKLIKKGALKIRGCLNSKKFYSVSAQIMVEGSPEAISWLVKKLKNSPLVYHLVKTSGRYNLIVGVMAQSLKRIDEFISKEIMTEPGVKHTEFNVGELPIIPEAWNPPIT
jgi:ATP phosphoribosyltransferase